MRPRDAVKPTHPKKDTIPQRVLMDGAAWDDSTVSLMHAWERAQGQRVLVSEVKGTKGPARLGARQVKDFERIHNEGEKLSQEVSTLFRALAARANYLSMDRPDCQYACKELCRGFSSPSRKDHTRLKRLVKYLVGRPRMIRKFSFQN